MTVGLDYSSGPINPAAILTAGYNCVFRYVDDPSYGPPAKCITPAEYADLTTAGVQVFLVFEHLTDDYTGGFLSGAEYGQRALTGANWLGYSGPIFMAIDTHLAVDEIPVAIDYLDGAGHILGSRLAAYGFPELIQAVQSAFPGIPTWQCGNPPAAGSGVNVWQDNTMTTTVDGVQCDIDRILIPFDAEDDMAQVPQDQWDDVYTQICGLFAAWAGGTTGDPNNAEYDFIQYLLRANQVQNFLTQQLADLQTQVNNLSTATVGNLSDTDVQRIAAAVMDSMATKLKAA